MRDATDMELLRQYANRNSNDAFATLVSRHVNMVYSAALRKTGNPHAAEEITQAVFIILAQKAGRIPDKTILPGWLYQTARLTAASFRKREIRRVRREQEAYMQTELQSTAPDETWEQLAPLLEDAMGQLGERDQLPWCCGFLAAKVSPKWPRLPVPTKTPRSNGSTARWKSCTAISPNTAFVQQPTSSPGRSPPTPSKRHRLRWQNP